MRLCRHFRGQGVCRLFARHVCFIRRRYFTKHSPGHGPHSNPQGHLRVNNLPDRTRRYLHDGFGDQPFKYTRRTRRPSPQSTSCTIVSSTSATSPVVWVASLSCPMIVTVSPTLTRSTSVTSIIAMSMEIWPTIGTDCPQIRTLPRLLRPRMSPSAYPAAKTAIRVTLFVM